MLILRLGWRNMWRNGRRTAITVAAISLTTALSIVMYALMTGCLEKMTYNATHLVAGDAEVHAPGYRQDRSIYTSLPEPQSIVQAARSKGIAAAQRSYAAGLLANGARSAGVMFWGVDPAAERETLDLPGQVFPGTYLGETQACEIVLGQSLAKSLQAEVGQKIVAMVQAADGSLGSEMFHVVGILRSAGEQVDRQAAIICRGDFDRLFVSEGRIHEIVLSGRGKRSAMDVAAAVGAGRTDIEVLTWRQLLPQFASIVDFWSVVVLILGAIFGLASGLGVVNTMLMATCERIREFGILKALGTAPRLIVFSVAAESSLMAAISTAAGVCIGCAVTAGLHSSGIDLGWLISDTISVSGVIYDPVLRPVLSVRVVALPVLMMWFACVAAAMYPAIKAARTEPVRAMAHV